MLEIKCPSCGNPMGIEENEPNTEWECPVCATVFRVQHGSGGELQLTVIPVDSSAIQAAPARNKRRRRVETTAEEPDLNISLHPQSPFQNRFPDLQPGQPPSLFTFNGMGTMMYGSRDFDEATGTYVTSACFVIVFIPIFIIGSYRVADAPAEGWFSTGGWHVLGKVPLSPLAKGWNYAMLGVIGLVLLTCMFSAR